MSHRARIFVLFGLYQSSSASSPLPTFLLDVGAASSATVSPGLIGFSGPEATLDVLSAPISGGGFTPRASYARLMRLLGGGSGGIGPSHRFGHIWGTANGVRPSHVPQTYIQVTPELGARLAACADAWGLSVTLCIPPLWSENASFVVATGVEVAAHIPHALLRGLELANEPDISSFAHAYPAYVAALGRWCEGLASVPGLPFPVVAAPVTAGSAWWPDVPAFLERFNASLTRFVQHRYALEACHATPTIAQLMNASTAWHTPQWLELLAAVARANMTFIIGEGNTVACNGTSGVSDVFASALYAVSALFDAAQAGVTHYAWHGTGDPVPGFAYQPVYYDPALLHNPGWDVAEVRPIFLGLWAFAEAVPPRSTLLTTASSGTAVETGALLRAWASRDAGGALERAAVLHKDTLLGDVAVSVAPSVPCAPGDVATLSRLLAGIEGFAARTGSSWRGRSFDGSTNGEPVGAPTDEHVPCSAAGRFDFSLPAASGAFLAWPRAVT